MTISSLPIFPDVMSIVDPFPGILLDAYGVFWQGNKVGLLPHSKNAMENLINQGKVVGILSNSTQLARDEIEKYKRHGLYENVHFHFLTTSGEVAKTLFQKEVLAFETPRKKFWVFCPGHPHFQSYQKIFEGSIYSETKNLSEADFIYVAIPHIHGEDQTDARVFQEEIQKLVKTNLYMVCPNPDLYAHEGNPARLVVRQGSIAALFKEMGGKVFYIGKPDAKAYNATMAHFFQKNITKPSEILMVGDTPETDIRGAKEFGMHTALVTKTGIMAERLTLQNFKELPIQDQPEFYIERFSNGL